MRIAGSKPNEGDGACQKDIFDIGREVSPTRSVLGMASSAGLNPGDPCWHGITETLPEHLHLAGRRLVR